MSIRHELSQFCAKLTFDVLPEDVVQHTKLCILDELPLLIAGPGAFSEDYPDFANFVGELGGKEECSIVGLGGKFPCLNATLANTTIGTNTAFGAIHKSTIIHLPEVLFPAAIAVAERQKASGKDLILAIVIGAEIMGRVGISLGTRNTYARGFHPTSICGPLGCAAAAGKLLRLSEGELAEAFSIAGVQAAGSSVHAAEYPFSWSFQIGRAAQSGILAAMLAQRGFGGLDMIFEDARGFLTAYSESSDTKKLTEGLGQTYEIKELILKRFGVGVYMMTGIECLLQMLQNHQISTEEIEEITVKLTTVVMPLVGFPEYPENRAGAQVSCRYILAATALMGSQIAYDIDLSAEKNRKDPRVIDLFNRTHVAGDPELDKVFPEQKSCILTIRTKDGRQFTQRNDGPFKGDPENPLSEADIETKFNTMTIPVLGQERASQIISSIKQLDKLGDVSKLVDLLTA